MLIRNQETAEDRIARIADGFQKGFQNFQSGQEQQRQVSLQDEARRRQQALQELEAEAKLTESTGRNFIGSGVGSQLFSGGMQGIGELMKSTPMTPKYELEQKKLERQMERESLQDEKTRAELAEQNKPVEQTRDFQKAAKLQEMKNANRPVKLPIETDTQIRTMAKKNADSGYIVGLLDTFIKNSEKYTDDQLLTQGRQLIKTLNSTISADATGAEEVKRLGTKLQFGTGNLFNDNPIQFGRDLQGFRKQVMDTRDIMSGAMEKNASEISRLRGDVSQPVNTRQAAPININPKQVQAVKQLSDADLVKLAQELGIQ